MTTKKIGIAISKVGENSVGLTLSYLEFAAQYGEPILLLPDSSFRDDLDLLILPGGLDVDTSRYGQRPSYFTGKPDIYKEYFDRMVLPQYIENETPIFAICRGEQSIAVHFGAKLIQHMDHETNKPEDPYKCVHQVRLDPIQFWNWREFSNEMSLEVNSRHHQAVDPRGLPEELIILGRHLGDGTIELLAHNSLPIVAIQFHAEDISNYNTNMFVDNIINRLIETRKSILQDE